MKPPSLDLIIERLDQQDKYTALRDMNTERDNNRKHEENIVRLLTIEEQVRKTNGRVSRLEAWRNIITGALALISMEIGWWVVWYPHK